MQDQSTASISPAASVGRHQQSPSASQRMMFELTETKPVELPAHLRYKSPSRTKADVFQGTSGRYLEAKTPAPEPAPILGHPDFESIHRGLNGGYSNTGSRYLDEKKEAPAQTFQPLAGEEGVRYDPEVQQMKDLAAKLGFPGSSRYEEDTQNKTQFEQGKSPRDLAEVSRREKLGIHPRTFRPVSEVCAKTFDEYASMARVWKSTHGIAEEGGATKKMNRPSVVAEYVRHGTPILNRKGKPITPTGQEKERVEEIRRRPRKEFHFKPSPFAGDFTHGPGMAQVKGYGGAVKESFTRERQMIENLASRLSGHDVKYSPARLKNLATPFKPATEEQRPRSRTPNSRSNSHPAAAHHTTPQDNVAFHTRRLDDNFSTGRSSQPQGGAGQQPQSAGRGTTPVRSKTPQGPQRPRKWR